MTLATVSVIIHVFFLTVRADTAYRRVFFHVAGTYVEMCKSFKKTLYETVRQSHRSERFEPNTVLWAFHTIQPYSYATLHHSSVRLRILSVIIAWKILVQRADFLWMRYSLLNAKRRPTAKS